ncbi:GTP-binding protein ypt5 [Oopsacas minuta]|uniref:GTP-binding protein ypt5 n=1 Tax=Oopsacas minuta TaxID=111878 RepID=A0AAV7JYZ0_9METZ|nr:GTP-binding protein ypt5 [Oopsacas minuta]
MAKSWHKVVVLGSKSVGKSSFITRKLCGVFEETLNTKTKSRDFFETNHKYKEETYNFRIYESNSQREVSEMPMVFLDARAAVIIYSCKSGESCREVADWINQVRANFHNEMSIPIVICESNIDTQDKKETDFSKVEKQYGELPEVEGCVQTSAKLGTGIDEAFDHLAEAIKRREYRRRPMTPPEPSPDPIPCPYLCSCFFFF